MTDPKQDVRQQFEALAKKFRDEGNKDDRGDAFLSGIRHAYELCADDLDTALRTLGAGHVE